MKKATKKSSVHVTKTKRVRAPKQSEAFEPTKVALLVSTTAVLSLMIFSAMGLYFSK